MDPVAAASTKPVSDRPFLGRAIVAGQVRFLSVSQLKAFDPSQDGGCNRRWAFRYVFGRKEETTAAQQAGTELAKQLEHYLKTGEDVLVPVLRAGKHLLPVPGPDLEVEKDLGDTAEALRLREAFLRAQSASERDSIARDLLRAAGLVAANIPLVGAADFRHRRGEYVDADGVVKREIYGDRVVECGDHKSTKRIDTHRSSGGKIYQGWAKTVEQILADIQMVGYGVHGSNRHPDITHVRLGHIYYQTQGALAASKRSGLLEVGEARRRWERVDALAREIEGAARAADPSEVPYNLRACHSFGRECPHAADCDRPARSVVDILQIGLPRQKGDIMSNGLFDRKNPGANGTQPPAPAQPSLGLFASTQAIEVPPIPPPPPMSDAERTQAIEAEKARLAAEEGLGFCRACGAKLVAENTSRLPSGEVKHVGCGAVSAAPQVSWSARAAGYNGTVGAVNPPDAPPPDAIASADPIPPEAVAAIPDPEVKRRVEEHAAAHAARAAEAAAGKEETAKKSGRCGSGGQVLVVTPQQTASRKFDCPGCGKKMPIRDKDFLADFTSITIPKHNMAKSENAPPPAPPIAPPLPAVSTAPDALPGQMMLPQTAPPPAPPLPALSPSVRHIFADQPPAPPILDGPRMWPPLPVAEKVGVTLYVDVVVERGDQPKSLDDYVTDLVRTIERQMNVPDLRYVPRDHQLDYGRWKGFLAGMVRAPENKLAPGVYVIHGLAGSEIKQVVLEALAPLCDVVVRGVR